MENRLETQGAPSGLLPSGISAAMMELRGRARPRTPLKLGANGSV